MGSVFALAACSSATHPVTAAGYLDEVATITATMTEASMATLQQGATPTRLQVQAISGLRDAALRDIRKLAPPDDVLPEHRALVRALGDLVDASRSFIDDTADLDQEGFVAALVASTALDSLAADVRAACSAMERRSHELDHPVVLGC